MNQADNIMKTGKHPTPAYAPPKYAPPAYAPTYRGLKSSKLVAPSGTFKAYPPSYGPGFGGGKIFPGLWQEHFFSPPVALPIFQMGKHTKFQSQYQDAYGNQNQGQKFGKDQIQNQNQNALGTQQIGQSVDGRLQVAGQEAGGRQEMNQADNIMKKVKHPTPAYAPPKYAPPAYAPTYRGLKSSKLVAPSGLPKYYLPPLPAALGYGPPS